MNAHLLGAVSQDDWLAVPSLRHKKSATSIASEGSTWSAVMYPQLIQSLSPEERKRQEAIFEFIKTEQSYVRDLQVVMDVFIQPLTLGPHAATILGPNHVATGKQMFANWEEILITNVAFLSDLELRQEQDDGLVGAPGEVILEHIGSMRCYMQFCTGQKQALTTLTQLLRDRLEFKDFIKQRQGDPRCRSLDLSSYLLKPVQRLTRYPLLIKQVLHYTPEVHSDHPALVQCLSTAEKVLHEVNEGARTEEDNIKFAEIAARVDLVVGQSVRFSSASAPFPWNI
ncbi:Dbl homology domain-containing protein [Blastocladiella britannica]|nr:Dbl homology domain-containing protein [Blastocladiella britannica]